MKRNYQDKFEYIAKSIVKENGTIKITETGIEKMTSEDSVLRNVAQENLRRLSSMTGKNYTLKISSR